MSLNLKPGVTSRLPNVTLLLCVMAVTADHLVVQSYAASDCTGAPIFSYLTKSGACAPCGGQDGTDDSATFCTLSCTNSTYGVTRYFTTQDCSGQPESASTYSGFSCDSVVPSRSKARTTRGDPYDPFPPLVNFPGQAYSFLCYPGQYVKPLTGLAVTQLNPYTKTPSCIQQPYSIMTFTTDTCMSTPANLQSLKATCGVGQAALSYFTGSSCVGTAYLTETYVLGCNTGNYSLVDCALSPPTSPSASTFSVKYLYAGAAGVGITIILGCFAALVRRACLKTSQRELDYEPLAGYASS